MCHPVKDGHSVKATFSLPVCHDKIVSGSWAVSPLGHAVLMEFAEHLYGSADTFLSYTGYETL